MRLTDLPLVLPTGALPIANRRYGRLKICATAVGSKYVTRFMTDRSSVGSIHAPQNTILRYVILREILLS